MKSLFLSCVLMLTILSVYAQKVYTPTSGTVTFQIKNAGMKVDGYFDGLLIEAKFSPEALSSSSIYGKVDAASINTGINGRDNHLRKEEYFDVANHPLIKLKSKSFTAKGAGNFEGIFTVTIKGISKDITIPFSVSENQGITTFKSEFVINRRDFKVGGSSWTMSDEVKMKVVFNAK